MGSNHDPDLKHRLIEYNQDDCRALKVVTDYATSVAVARSCDEETANNSSTFVHTENLLAAPSLRPRFGKAEFIVPEFEFANRCAFFDYQRDRVFVRTNDSLRRSLSRKKRKASCETRKNRPNKRIEFSCERCPACGNAELSRFAKAKKTIHDIRFFRGGLKKWVTQYTAGRYKCKSCGHAFKSKDYRRLVKNMAMD